MAKKDGGQSPGEFLERSGLAVGPWPRCRGGRPAVATDAASGEPCPIAPWAATGCLRVHVRQGLRQPLLMYPPSRPRRVLEKAVGLGIVLPRHRLQHGDGESERRLVAVPRHAPEGRLPATKCRPASPHPRLRPEGSRGASRSACRPTTSTCCTCTASATRPTSRKIEPRTGASRPLRAARQKMTRFIGMTSHHTDGSRSLGRIEGNDLDPALQMAMNPPGPAPGSRAALPRRQQEETSA